jgi:hypothetical protein
MAGFTAQHADRVEQLVLYAALWLRSKKFVSLVLAAVY